MELQQTTKELNTYRVLVLCAIVILLEGFDIQAAGVSAPKLTLAFNLAPLGKGYFSAPAQSVFLFRPYWEVFWPTNSGADRLLFQE